MTSVQVRYAQVGACQSDRIRPALHELAQRQIRERILDRHGRCGATAIVERGCVRIALLHGVDKAIGANAVIEHSRATADHELLLIW